jgi:hypothetical protein
LLELIESGGQPLIFGHQLGHCPLDVSQLDFKPLFVRQNLFKGSLELLHLSVLTVQLGPKPPIFINQAVPFQGLFLRYRWSN